MNLPKRKPNRLKDFDYGQPGAYFITFCTKNRECLFWEEYEAVQPFHEKYCEQNVGAAICRPPLSDYGKIVEHAILSVPEQYPNVAVDQYVVMPNHVHLILRIMETDGRQVAAPTVSNVIGRMKWYVSQEIGRPIWQKSFHDHVIRNETDWREIWEYIENNPAKWAEDRYCKDCVGDGGTKAPPYYMK